MKNVLPFFIFSLFSVQVVAQGVKISASQGSPDTSSILELESSTQGLLPPRMTTVQRDAIEVPALGLQIFNTTTNCNNFFNGLTWQEICGSCTPQSPAPSEGVHVPAETQIEWNWNTVSGALGYKWNTSNNYATANDVDVSTTYTQTGLSSNTPYVLYIWSYNICGGSPSSTVLNETTSPPPCTVGSVGPAGGYMFYCGNAYAGYSGLEAASVNQSTNAFWGCVGTGIPGADASAIGSGYQNTADILSGCPEAGIAARLCDDLVLSGYNDWFLPSEDEIGLMYTNLYQQSLGGFSGDFWSSTEVDNLGVWSEGFGVGSGYSYKNNGNFKVRCVRRF